MDQELAKKISQRGGIGLGERLYRQVLRREETPGAADREAGPKVEENGSR
jgi:Rod binding domain-containing protein